MAVDPFAGVNQGLRGLQDTMLNIYQMKRQEKQDAQANSLHALQMQGAQQDVEQGALSLSKLRGDQNALIGQYGTQDQSDPYGRAMELQGSEAMLQKEQQQKQQEMEADNKGFQILFQNQKFLKEAGVPNEQRVAFAQAALKQNPRLAPLAQYITAMEEDGTLEAERDFQTGELVDPISGQPLPAGRYATKGQFTGEPGKPFKLLSYKLVEPKQDHETWGEPEQMTVGGKTALVQKSSRGQIRPVIQDTAPRVTVTTGGGGGGKPMPLGKPPIGYRYTADGSELEPIPGGPASQKVVTAAKAQEGAVQSISTAIEAANKLLNHPGRTAATGTSSLFNLAAIPGGDRKTFLNDLETFRSQMFIPMVQQMKGMGQLSDAEGKKLLAAVGNLEASSSEADFVQNLKGVISNLEQTLDRTGQSIATGPTGKQPARNAAPAKAVTKSKSKSTGYSDLLNKYRKP